LHALLRHSLPTWLETHLPDLHPLPT
jgi:hypothetical protein